MRLCYEFSLVSSGEHGLSEAHIARAKIASTTLLVNNNFKVVVAASEGSSLRFVSRIPEVAAEIAVVTISSVLLTNVSFLALLALALLRDRVALSV